MSEKINKNDIIEDKILSAFINESIEAEKRIKAFDDRLKSLAETIRNDLSKSTDLNIDNLQKWNALEKEAEKRVKQKKQNVKDLSVVEKERLNIQKAVEKAQAQKILADSKENKELQKLRAEKNKINKATRDEIKQVERNKNAYTKLSDASRRYKNESKTLGAELLALEQAGKKNSRVWNEIEKEYSDVTKKAQITDKQLKKLDSTVGDNTRRVGTYENATRGLSRAFNVLGISMGVGMIARNTFNTLSEFDEKVADVSKTTGLATEQARELSVALFDIDTRSTITELQELASAAGRLGIEGQENILGFVTAADKAFVALGDDLEGTAEEIATTLGKVSATFGTESEFGVQEGIEKTGSVMNELATNSKASAGAILDFTQRMAGVASQANIAQTDIQSLGALFDSTGQSIEVAGSTLAKLLPALSKDQERFAKIAGLSAENFSKMLEESPIEALKAVARGAKSSEAGLNGLNETIEAFGVDSARAAGIVGILASETDQLTELQGIANKAFEENISLTNEFNTKNETVQANLDKLSKEWDKIIIGTSEATGASRGLSNVLGFLADNLGTIISYLGRALVAFASYKAVLLAVNIQQKLAGKSAGDLARSFFSLGKNAKDASGESSKMGKVLKGIGWTVLIGFALDLGKAFYNIATGASRARFEAEQLEKAQQRIGGANLERINAVNKALDDRLKNIQQQLDLEEISAEKAEQLRQDAINGAKNQLEEEKSINKERAKELQGQIKIYERATEILNTQQTGIPLSNRALSDLMNEYGIELGNDPFDELSKLKAELQSYEATVKALTTEQRKLNTESADSAHSYKVLSKSATEAKKATEKLTGAREWANEKDDEYISNLDEIIRKERERREEMERIESGEFEVGIGEAPLLPEDEVDEVTDQQKELYDTINTAQENITKAYEDHVDRRIELAQKEIDSQKELRNILKVQAEAGNIDAQDSIKATIDAEREKEAEIVRLEKRKQQVQMISQGLQTYLSLLEGGEKPAAALAQTAITSKGLIQLLSGLQGFWTGTDYAPEGLAWTQEKGAEIITDKKGNIKSLGSDGGSQLTYLEKGDKVKTASETTKFLNSFENLNNEQRMPKQDVAGNSYDIMLLGSKLDRIERAIKTQPQSSSDFQTITKSLSVLTKTTNSGGDKSISKHYIKR